jgi:hypothetical protein
LGTLVFCASIGQFAEEPMSEESTGGEVSAGPGAEAPQPARTSIPRVLGILLIITGSLLALGGVIGGLVTFAAGMLVGGVGAMGDAMGDAGTALADMDILRPVYNAQGAMKVTEGLLSIVAIVAGVWLLGYRRRGRLLALIWAGLALAFLVADFGVYFAVILPATREMMELTMSQMGDLPGMGAAMPEGFGSFAEVGAVGFVAVDLFLALLPVVTIALVTRRSVADACN